MDQDQEKATANHIALQYSKNGWTVVPQIDFVQILYHLDPNVKQFFVVNDVIGAFAVDLNMLEKVKLCESFVFSWLNKKTKIVCTCKKQVSNELSKSKLRLMHNIIDLESVEMSLNETERKEMLEFFCKTNNIDTRQYKHISPKHNFMHVSVAMLHFFKRQKIAKTWSDVF